MRAIASSPADRKTVSTPRLRASSTRNRVTRAPSPRRRKAGSVPTPRDLGDPPDRLVRPDAHGVAIDAGDRRHRQPALEAPSHELDGLSDGCGPGLGEGSRPRGADVRARSGERDGRERARSREVVRGRTSRTPDRRCGRRKRAAFEDEKRVIGDPETGAFSRRPHRRRRRRPTRTPRAHRARAAERGRARRRPARPAGRRARGARRTAKPARSARTERADRAPQRGPTSGERVVVLIVRATRLVTASPLDPRARGTRRSGCRPPSSPGARPCKCPRGRCSR